MRTLRRAIYLLLSPVLGTLWFCWFVTVFAFSLNLAMAKAKPSRAELPLARATRAG